MSKPYCFGVKNGSGSQTPPLFQPQQPQQKPLFQPQQPQLPLFQPQQPQPPLFQPQQPQPPLFHPQQKPLFQPQQPPLFQPQQPQQKPLFHPQPPPPLFQPQQPPFKSWSDFMDKYNPIGSTPASGTQGNHNTAATFSGQKPKKNAVATQDKKDKKDKKEKPLCRYGSKCNRDDCWFGHPERTGSDKPKPDPYRGLVRHAPGLKKLPSEFEKWQAGNWYWLLSYFVLNGDMAKATSCLDQIVADTGKSLGTMTSDKVTQLIWIASQVDNPLLTSYYKWLVSGSHFLKTAVSGLAETNEAKHAAIELSKEVKWDAMNALENSWLWPRVFAAIRAYKKA